MRTVRSVAAQSVLFLVTFFLGSFILHPFHLQSTLASDDAHTRVFLWDGLVLMVILYLLVLALAAIMKRLRGSANGSAMSSTIAVVLAGALGLIAKFGFITVDR